MNGIPVLDMKHHKHLGCILQHNAKWDININGIITKCSRRISIWKDLKYHLDRHTLKILFKEYIKPVWEYASAV